MSLLTNLFGDDNSKLLKKYESRIPKINSIGEALSKLSDDELAAKTVEFKKKISKAKEDGKNVDTVLDEILAEAFAVVREAATRTLGERHYEVQLVGGMAIHDGNISEMRTGEGKTLVSTLPSYLNALTGNGVHIVTVNDFLARRDAVWMGQIYNFLGLSVGILNQQASYLYDVEHINKDEVEEKDEERDETGSFHIVHDFLKPCDRKEAYKADITVGTNSEFGFDYLRDNIEYEVENLRQRDYNFAIIDEIDSILIDEARTPLIISAPSNEAENLYDTFSVIAKKMKIEEDYTVDEKMKSISLTDDGITKAEKSLGVDNIYTEKGIKYVHHLETAVRAEALFTLDKDYVVKDGQVIIVDEFTGRLQPSRRWSEGLHQAVEAKEGIEVGQESRTFASITYQNYFRMYKKLSGMTGTAKTSAEEFYKVYKLDTVTIPTNKDIARIDNNDLIYQTEEGKMKALTRRIKELHEKGQPVLVGTVSIEKNEYISNYLTREGIPHNLLNAKNHENEAEIVAQAGKKGAVTIATNMAGRGVDIKLGGEPFNTESYEAIKEIGGLYVIGTERHEARRIDNQLRGRAGRQGDPGETQFFVSMEDSLMRVFASDTVKNMMGKLGIPEDEPIQNRMISKSLESAQTKIEGFHFDSRKQLLEFDSVLNTQRTTIYKRRRKISLDDMEAIEAEVAEIISRDDDIAKVISEKKELLGEENWNKTIKRMLLQSIDTFWVDHLETMDYTRSSVGLRAYGQRDPLIEYKKEALVLFRNMQEGIYEQIIRLLPNVGEGAFLQAEKKLRENVKKAQMESGKEESSGGNFIPEQASTPAPGEAQSTIGRNDKVTLVKGDETMEIKFKKADEYLADGWTIK